jgi:hypothetical protein
VGFPERANENPFVARLWAAQRIGFLSAERRRNGASPELDNEIRTLGERFSIPTEFTSYFVKEPNMVQPQMVRLGRARNDAGMAAGGSAGGAANAAPPAAAPAPVAQFEAARAAADQRAMKSTAALGEVVATSASGPVERYASGRTFRFADSVWTEVRPAGNTREVTVKAYSKAYFDLLKQIPELAKLAGLGEQITVVGRGVVVSIRTTKGVETLTGAELSRIAADW